MLHVLLSVPANLGYPAATAVIAGDTIGYVGWWRHRRGMTPAQRHG